MASVAPARVALSSLRADSEGMNTIPDPRSPSPASFKSRGSSNGSAEHHPDLSNEVATLSTKLINAINHQTALDDSLQETRHELEQAREQIARLEKAAKEHQALISQGLLVKKEEVELRHGTLRNDLQREIQQRESAEKEKRRMESELENLTASLFEEANTMVADARRETDAANHRVEQLKAQMLDAETLLSSHQEQLQDLKAVMQQMSEKDENEAATHLSSAPSTPGLAHNKMSRMFDVANLLPATPDDPHDIEPQPPLFYHQLLTPNLRTDLPAYLDFQSLLRTSRDLAAAHSAVSSRTSSGNFSALTSMSIGLGSTSNMAYTHAFHHQSAAAAAASTPPQTPKLPPSAGSTSADSPRESLLLSQPLPPLKEAKYFKRVLTEDIEPTLRLDLAPGLSWLNKRFVLNGLINGSLAIEPAPRPPTITYLSAPSPCALCGENGKQEKYVRRHQFRVAEDGGSSSNTNNDSDPNASSTTSTTAPPPSSSSSKGKAQRWPICDWCLARVRSTCDLVGFLRMCQAGLWKADTPERARDAWEEGVRLRERMFWARVGGGVVPSFVGKGHDDTGAAAAAPALPPRGSGEQARQQSKSDEDVFKSKDGAGKRVSIGKTVVEPKTLADPKVARSASEKVTQNDDGRSTPTSEENEAALARQLQDEMSVNKGTTPQPQSLPSESYVDAQQAPQTNTGASPPADGSVEGDKASRLSVTIPGAF